MNFQYLQHYGHLSVWPKIQLGLIQITLLSQKKGIKGGFAFSLFKVLYDGGSRQGYGPDDGLVRKSVYDAQGYGEKEWISIWKLKAGAVTYLEGKVRGELNNSKAVALSTVCEM